MTALRVLRTAARRPQPWRNNGGTTTEVAVGPDNAGPDAFDWRISIAAIDHGGPFSVFAGIDRILVVLDGALRLRLGNATPLLLHDG